MDSIFYFVVMCLRNAKPAGRVSNGATFIGRRRVLKGRRGNRSPGIVYTYLCNIKIYCYCCVVHANVRRARRLTNDDNARPNASRCERRLYAGHVGQVPDAAAAAYI